MLDFIWCGIASIFLLSLFFLVQLTKKTSEGFTFESDYLLDFKNFRGIYFSASMKKILFFIFRFNAIIYIV